MEFFQPGRNLPRAPRQQDQNIPLEGRQKGLKQPRGATESRSLVAQLILERVVLLIEHFEGIEG